MFGGERRGGAEPNISRPAGRRVKIRCPKKAILFGKINAGISGILAAALSLFWATAKRFAANRAAPFERSEKPATGRRGERRLPNDPAAAGWQLRLWES